MGDKKTALVVSVDSTASCNANLKITYSERNQRVLPAVTSVLS